MLDMLIRLLKSLDWAFDWYIAPLTYNGYKMHRYFEYMINKWGQRFLDRVEQDYVDKYP